MIKFEVEYEIPQIRFANVYCPKCDTKFDALKHGATEDNGRLCDGIDLKFGKFKCPECGNKFETRDMDVEIITK